MADNLVPFEGSVPVNKHQFIDPADPHGRIDVTIKLRRKSEKELPTLDEFVVGQRSSGITRQVLSETHGTKPRAHVH
jgi:hypothetical protein